ncbi:MAG: pantetheine-phosphate adenylyltransferase [Promethearchaeota archaeon]
MTRYIVGLGGTFDHLHEGHEKLLEIAFTLGKRVVIGLTTDNMLENKKYHEYLESFDKRRENLVNYARGLGRDADLEILPLNDPFGPAISDPRLEVHVSSEETFDVSRQINKLREKNGLDPLILVMVPLVKNDHGQRFSSTSIRKEIQVKEHS